MKKWWLLTGLILIGVAIWINGSTQPKVLNAWAENEESPVVLQNKVWQIVLSTKLNPATVNSENIYVTNSDGELQETTVSLDDTHQSIKIHPPETGYDLTSEYFTLHINDGIRSALGRKIDEVGPLKFIVKKTLPNIGSKERLIEYFSQAIKAREKKTTFLARGDSNIAEESMNSADSAMSGAKNTVQDFSETNVQVKGIDEPDILKNDGTYLYQILENRVVITKAYPAKDLKGIATINFPNHEFTPHELLYYEDRLIVIGHSYQNMPFDEKRSSSTKDISLPINHSLKAKIYDIADRSVPVLEREVDIEGNYLSARRSNEFLYLISSYHPYLPRLEGKHEVDLRPRVRDSANSSDPEYIDYEWISYIPQSKDTNYTIISAIPIDRPDERATFTTYLGSGDQIYMSKKNLYLAVNMFPDLTEETRFTGSPDTSIYKFSIDGSEIRFEHSIEIEGAVLNQFSMDEYEGNFRVATTSGEVWNDERPSSSHLFIFNEDFKKIGELTGLAKGERIYSARFMNERIYIVTFKQVDPLFVIDASDPSNPVVKGELKIPGFSNYLHPYDENHIIGFGQNTKVVDDASDKEPIIFTDGIKISLFDVTDMSNPTEKFTEIIGGNGTYSPLNHDHKALLFDKKRNLFAFPIHIYNYDEKTNAEENFFQGAFVYHLALEKGFQLEQKLSHSTREDGAHHIPWESEIQRLTLINDALYTVSQNRIVAHELSTYEEIAKMNHK